MESIVAAYGSASDSDNASSSDSEVEGSDAREWAAGDDTQVGAKRKRSDEPQWKRAFPHVDGNWPSHVRIDIVVTPELREVARQIIEGAQKLVDNSVALVPFEGLGLGDFTPTEGNSALHLSLSRPFVLTYDQIDGFVDSLRAALKWRQRFSITLRCPLVLLNDDKTRSFLALRVSEGEQQFAQVLRCVDQCLTQFKLPTYYKDPIPHVSIASSIGEELAQLTLDQCESLTPQQEKQQIARPCFTACVAAVHVAIGNKHYDISLR